MSTDQSPAVKLEVLHLVVKLLVSLLASPLLGGIKVTLLNQIFVSGCLSGWVAPNGGNVVLDKALSLKALTCHLLFPVSTHKIAVKLRLVSDMLLYGLTLEVLDFLLWEVNCEIDSASAD